jgi:pilus assembly protein Flp/PilA
MAQPWPRTGGGCANQIAESSPRLFVEESQMKQLITRFVREEEGQDLIEYALLATFVALVVVAGATLLGTNLNTWYTNMSTTVGGWAAAAS